MQNQAAVEALYSATFVEDYLDCVENLPSDLQRHLSRLREFDLIQYSVSSNVIYEFQLNKSLIKNTFLTLNIYASSNMHGNFKK